MGKGKQNDCLTSEQERERLGGSNGGLKGERERERR